MTFYSYTYTCTQQFLLPTWAAIKVRKEDFLLIMIFFTMKMLKNDIIGFLVLSFRHILIYFFSFMHQGHMGFIAISESAPFGLSKTIFTFPQYFLQVLG